ncbi:hypothetical protein SAMN05192559_105200 [Halobacillus karajensis]|uniref:Uncharacterized protein n=1 Tax=Halobacillus karajensis TaxID=195088 RepID=A0A024P6L8_9BACI|nr:hypothetical protein [Halobacillus karajensis]CDQ20534.1 hypothetical protein BN982_02879 [Halobacillus karajensis]CDQ23997.1 hypothetical protein BN983_02258 [Halobacillus karajensis]CDQ27475.1 hypothetical protein BN981_01739 [Halobacillus karajensis]SEH90230.1 hypothetical protein SAMN05192559_105200 [Halobacillus karajensis]
MLTFEEKLNIIEEFPELEKKEISLGRVNFHYEESLYEKKIVVYRLHPNGNGFIFAGEIEGYPTDEKGMVNIKELGADEIRTLLREAIDSLSLSPAEKNPVMEEWLNDNDQSLVLMREEDGFNVYAEEQLEGTFNSYEEAVNFLEQEGFSRL